MGMTRPEYSPAISLGNMLQIAALLVSVGASWAVMSSSLDNQTLLIEQARIERRDFDSRIRVLEAQAARADERFVNILTLLARIDARLERIEKGERP